MRQIPDLMLCLQELNDGTVRQIRKTAEDPPRVAVYDVLQLVTGCSATNCSNVFCRVSEAFPEVLTNCSNFKFSGKGQRETPVAEARTIVEIIMVLPGRAAAQVRRAAAGVMVRYLGGDPSLVEEIAANRLRQEYMDDDDPARLFGQTVESAAIKRKREEVTLLELEGQAKRIRAQAATDVANLALGALRDLGLPISDRDRMLAKDMITSAAFTQAGQLEGEGEADICLQQFCASRGKRGQEAALGKKPRSCTWRTILGSHSPRRPSSPKGRWSRRIAGRPAWWRTWNAPSKRFEAQKERRKMPPIPNVRKACPEQGQAFLTSGAKGPAQNKGRPFLRPAQERPAQNKGQAFLTSIWLLLQRGPGAHALRTTHRHRRLRHTRRTVAR